MEHAPHTHATALERSEKIRLILSVMGEGEWVAPYNLSSRLKLGTQLFLQAYYNTLGSKKAKCSSWFHTLEYMIRKEMVQKRTTPQGQLRYKRLPAVEAVEETTEEPEKEVVDMDNTNEDKMRKGLALIGEVATDLVKKDHKEQIEAIKEERNFYRAQVEILQAELDKIKEKKIPALQPSLVKRVFG